MGDILKGFLVVLILSQIWSTHGFSNYRTAFQQEMDLTEKDVRHASADDPKRLFSFTASSLTSTVDVHFSMTNREKVPQAIQFVSNGNRCTIIVTAPLNYPEVSAKFPRGKIPIPMKASHADDPDDFALFNFILNLKDSNDHAPVFYENSLNAVIFPNQKLEDVNPILRLRAQDDDAVESGNGRITYRLKQLIFLRSDGSTSPGDLSAWFRIDKATGNVDLLQLPPSPSPQSGAEDQKLLLTVFASDSPVLSREAPQASTSTAVLSTAKVEDYIKYEIAINVVEGQGASPFNLTSIKLPPILNVAETVPLRFTILNRAEIPDEISVQGSTWLSLVSSRPLDYETDGPAFHADVLVENRDYGSTILPASTPLRAVVRIAVSVQNVEDEPPVFRAETLVSTVSRIADLRDVNPVLRVRVSAKEVQSPEKQQPRISIRSCVVKNRGQEALAYFNPDGAIDVEPTGNVNLLKSLNDIVDESVEEIMLEVVAEHGNLVAVGNAVIKLAH